MGRKVPRPTCSRTGHQRQPRASSSAMSASVKCRPAVGAATASPSAGMEDGLVAAFVLGAGGMGDVGGQGQAADGVHRVPVQVSPSGPSTRTRRRPSSRASSTCSSASTRPLRVDHLGRLSRACSRAPGRTRASKAPSGRARRSRASPFAAARRGAAAAGRGGPSRRWARIGCPRASVPAARGCCGGAGSRPAGSATRRRAPSRSRAGCWAISSGGRSKWKSLRFITSRNWSS